MINANRERLAEALAIERWKGSDAARYIAERIGALAQAGDTKGVVRFLEIASVLDQLRDRGPSGNAN